MDRAVALVVEGRVRASALTAEAALPEGRGGRIGTGGKVAGEIKHKARISRR